MTGQNSGQPFLDERDRHLLNALRENSRISFRDLAKIVNLSPNATAERVSRLQESGVILGFRTELSARALGLPLQAYIDIKLEKGVSMESFERALRRIPNVREAVSMTGAFDARLRVDCEGPIELGSLIEKIRSQAGVQETSSTVICRELSLKV
jgi:Lrp/AsnC family leucine-responsive transcriptional regulator